MGYLRCVLTLLFLTASAWAADDANKPGTTAEDYLRVIRAGDLTSLTALCKTGTAGVRDRLDWTPLHYAALYGTAEACGLFSMREATRTREIGVRSRPWCMARTALRRRACWWKRAAT
jgi:hypothetical protein